jgi:hypothetical protein
MLIIAVEQLSILPPPSSSIGKSNTHEAVHAAVVALAYTHRIGQEIGVDPELILATSHGRRSIDVLQIYEPKLANWECEYI